MSEPNEQEQADRLEETARAEQTKLDHDVVAVPPENALAEEAAAAQGKADDSLAEELPEEERLSLAGEAAEPAIQVDPRDEGDGNTAAVPNASLGTEADFELKSRQAADAQVLNLSRQHTRRSFLGAAAAVAAGFGVNHYLNVAPTENMQPVPLEDAYKFNATVSRIFLREAPLAPTYPLSRAETLRVNGIYGLKRDIVPESWRLQLVGMRNASEHSRFAQDVTAWEYRYMAPPANEDKGHDTKVDPRNEADAQPVPTEAHPSIRGEASPSAPAKKQKSSDSGASRDTPQTHSGDRAPEMMSSIKMAPAPVLQREMKRESGDDDESKSEDDNRSGRKPRGMEEAGESDSTLPPRTPGLLLQLADITRLPHVELVTQFKCIEGWSQIVHWAGVRMADFLEAYPPALIDGKEPRYVYMETPDGDYYTGYDLHVLRHPQTLLVTEMMGAPLTQNHGAPLRLHMPTKYGYKQIKRIGLIAYTNAKPDDYWTKLGYDWYAGL